MPPPAYGCCTAPTRRNTCRRHPAQRIMGVILFSLRKLTVRDGRLRIERWPAHDRVEWHCDTSMATAQLNWLLVVVGDRI